MSTQSSKESSFLMQATILATAGILVRLVGFLYRLPMQSMLGDEGTGIYAQGYNIFLLFFVISSAGFPAAISKMVSTRIALKQYGNAHKVFKIALVMAGSAGFASMFMLFFGAEWLSNLVASPDAVYSIQALAPAAFIVAIMSVYRGYFQGMGNTVPTAVSQVFEQVLNAAFSIWLVYVLLDEGLAMAAAGGTAGSGIGAFAGLIIIIGIYKLQTKRIRKNIKKHKQYAENESAGSIAKELLFTAAPIIAGTAIFSITNLIDTKMVISILTDTGFSHTEALQLFGQLNGKYVVITTLPVAIATALAAAVIPSIAKSVALNDRTATKDKVDMALRLTMIISIPAAFGVGILANQILLFLFPNNPDGGILLQVGAASIIFLALSQIATGMLQGMGKLKVPALAALCGAIVKIPLNYFLIAIPEINVVGAVISTTVCYMIASFINLTVVYRTTNTRPDIINVFLKPTASAIVMGAISYVSYYTVYFIHPNNTLALIISIFLSVIAYFIFMIIIKGIKRKDLETMPMGHRIINLLDNLGIVYG